jgi:RimJ/RimL family protein N-acetyltransferase
MSREAMIERPRTLALVEEEFWTVRDWRRYFPGYTSAGAGFVAEVDRRIAGSLNVRRGPRPVARHSAGFGIVVASWARGIGVGRALIEAAERWARDVGVERMTLEVFAHNERARRLYAAMGYEEEGIDVRAVRFPECDVDSIRMAKWLPRGE